jgi:ribosomal protein S1
VLAGCAQEPPQPVKIENTQEVRATVVAVDPVTRFLSLQGPDKNVVTVQVDDEVRNLPQVKVGDHVVVRYYEALGAELKSRGGTATSATSDPEAAVTVGRAEEGQRPAGVVSSQVSTVVKIKSVDTKNNVVEFYGEDGLVRAFPVQTDQGKEFIKKLKPGDEVGVSYVEALAVSVEPAPAQ